MHFADSVCKICRVRQPADAVSDGRQTLSDAASVAHGIQTAVRNANDVLIPATLERLFAADHG
jgi:hypothetical protein